MKNLFLTLAGFVLAATLFGQAPQRMNYQAVLRDANGVPQANTAGTLGLEVRQNTSTGLVVYSEVHNITTTTIGLAQVALGGGTVITGPALRDQRGHKVLLAHQVQLAHKVLLVQPARKAFRDLLVPMVLE